MCFFTVKLQQNLFTDVFFLWASMNKDRGMEQWAAKSSSAFFHLSITLADWVTHNLHIVSLDPTTTPGFMSTQCHLYTTRPQLSNLFSSQSELVAKWDQRKNKDTKHITLLMIAIIKFRLLYYTVKVNTLLCWLIFYWSACDVKWFMDFGHKSNSTKWFPSVCCQTNLHTGDCIN